MDKITAAEFVRLAHEAPGFGPDGSMSLVQWIEYQTRMLMMLDTIGDMQTTIASATAALARSHR